VGRRLGQHFLVRRSILERIAEDACPRGEPLVIEIGPGKGALTEYLMTRAERVVAIETDHLLVDHLTARFRDSGNLTVVHADVLATDLAQWGAAVVAGNLPYYITSPILERVLALGETLRCAVFLVQKEVAARLTALPGTRQYGFLTVRTLLAATPELLFPVPPSAFSPPPKVDSAVVRLTPHAPLVGDVQPFLSFVGRCFRQKRKTIRNNLTGLYDRSLLAEVSVTSQRAEQLSLDEFAELYRRLSLY
jgi:16S rRNA (adenine1518-N6/adenine1519-N6)-dimethyltransferase